ncbi:hypothetical protein GCM10018952_57650 [Streptosporangium vulgare]
MPAIRPDSPSASMISVAFCSMATARRGGAEIVRGRPQLVSFVTTGAALSVPVDEPLAPPQAAGTRRRRPIVKMGTIFIVGDCSAAGSVVSGGVARR